MKGKRRNFSAAYKAKVDVEVLKERESLAELSKRFEVHPTMISKWKQEFLQNSSATFEIELDNATGYFAHISRQDGKEVVKGIADGKKFYLLDGKQEISEEDRKKYDLTPESLK